MDPKSKDMEQNTIKAEEVTIECSWDIESLESVSQKIIWKEELAELTTESNIENCFMMSQPSAENPVSCTLKISLRNDRKFSGLQILSEVNSSLVSISDIKLY